MAVTSLILVETSLPGNLGAAMRVAANFGVAQVKLVRPLAAPDDPETLSWACGADDHVEILTFATFAEAAARSRTLIATASGRGRQNQTLLSLPETSAALDRRGRDDAALVFGNETRGLSRRDLDRCHLAVRVPTAPNFPVLNLTQAIAIVLGYLSATAVDEPDAWPQAAPQETVEATMAHLGRALALIGFLDPVNPDRILRKLRRVFGRAGLTENEAAIFRGICRQVEWAVGDRKNEGQQGCTEVAKDQPKGT